MPITEVILLITTIGGMFIAIGGWTNTRMTAKAAKDNDLVMSAMEMVKQWRSDSDAAREENVAIRKENRDLQRALSNVQREVSQLKETVLRYETALKQATVTTSTQLNIVSTTPQPTSTETTK